MGTAYVDEEVAAGSAGSARGSNLTGTPVPSWCPKAWLPAAVNRASQAHNAL